MIDQDSREWLTLNVWLPTLTGAMYESTTFVTCAQA
jgi:hypothetical protein